MAKRTTRSRGRAIKQNRPTYRKEVAGHTKKNHFNRPVKIKGKKWEKVKGFSGGNQP